MALKTTLEQLIENQDAISKVQLGMQSYTLDGRQVMYPTLETLMKEKRYLEKKYASEIGKRPRVSVGKMTRAFN